MENSNIVEEKVVLDAIKRQFDENDKVSFQFNRALYTELKNDIDNILYNTKEVQNYDNGRAR